MGAGVHASLTRFPGVMHEFFGMTEVVDSSRPAVRQADPDSNAAFEGPEPERSRVRARGFGQEKTEGRN